MTRIALLILAISAAPAMASSQLELSAQRVLNEYGFANVDAEDLGTAQLATILHIAGQSHGEGEKRGQIRSVLGTDTVIGLGNLFR